ncbi:hypothetical protein [Amycolatopsis magusensis]
MRLPGPDVRTVALGLAAARRKCRGSGNGK